LIGTDPEARILYYSTHRSLQKRSSLVRCVRLEYVDRSLRGGVDAGQKAPRPYYNLNKSVKMRDLLSFLVIIHYPSTHGSLHPAFVGMPIEEKGR
jgi:hypothetical protein